MKMSRKRERVSNQQLAFMVEFIELNPKMLSKKFSPAFTRENYKQLWEELTNRLNAFGLGAKKAAKQWQKCWSDQKYNLRGKAANFNKEAKKTGGGLPEVEVLTPIEEKILSLIGHQSAVGEVDIPEGGFEITPEETVEDTQESEIEQMQSNEIDKEMGPRDVHTSFDTSVLESNATPTPFKRRRRSARGEDNLESKIIAALESNTNGYNKYTEALNMLTEKQMQHTEAVKQQTAVLSELTKTLGAFTNSFLIVQNDV